jgi:hypothetical protein
LGQDIKKTDRRRMRGRFGVFAVMKKLNGYGYGVSPAPLFMKT